MTFLPGLDLAESFYRQIVGPLLRDRRHSAALLGTGSDVLGFDDVRSTDHGWGPRLQVFVGADDVEDTREALAGRLPAEHLGWATVFGWDDVPPRTHVDVWTIDEWVRARLGVDPRAGFRTADWLTVPQQLLLETTAGRVFHDGLDELARLRASLAWYPDDVWLWLLGAQWRRISQEEAFVGRTFEASDALGSRVTVARLVRDLMRLCFLLERRYAPYSKWLGTAFGRLRAATDVLPHLHHALTGAEHTEREDALCNAYEAVARRHNALGVTEPLDPSVRMFHGRPFRVLFADRFADACLRAVQDPWLKAQPHIGGVDQWVDSTDVLSQPTLASRLARRALDVDHQAVAEGGHHPVEEVGGQAGGGTP